MKHTLAKTFFSVRITRHTPLAVALLFASAQFSSAQSVVAPEVNSSALLSAPSSTTDVSAPAAPSSPSQLIWGPATFHPQISYRYLSTDGIQSQPGRKTRTDIQSISPGIAVEIGQHWSIRYIQTWNLYSSSAFRDTVDQAGGINWQTEYEAWKLTANHDYSRSDTPLIETGTQTRQTTHSSSLDAWYGLSSEYALETTLRLGWEIEITPNKDVPSAGQTNWATAFRISSR